MSEHQDREIATNLIEEIFDLVWNLDQWISEKIDVQQDRNIPNQHLFSKTEIQLLLKIRTHLRTASSLINEIERGE